MNERAQYFDGWYADIARSPAVDAISQRHMGLPPHLVSNSLLPWDGIAEVTEALRLARGDTLLDVACGRGGFGLEITARAGARLIGVDFSAEALRLAGSRATSLGRDDAGFRVADMTATGLQAASVQGVLCVDAIQFAEPPGAAYDEFHRVLAPGGRAVLTCWEPLDYDNETLSARLRGVRLRDGLTAAGFTDVEVIERPAWQERERAMWDEAAVLDPGEDPALRSLHDEGVRSVATTGLVRRVMATATRP